MTIDRLLRSDDGLYECIAENKGGKAYKNGHMTVEFPPTFTSMTNWTVYSWDQRPVNLSCIAESIPNATIRWTLNGEIPVENYINVIKYGNGPVSTITVTPLDKRFYVDYKCTAENIHGKATHTIKLREAEKPREIMQATIDELTATTVKFRLAMPPTQEELPIRTVTVEFKQSIFSSWANARNRTWAVGQ